MGLQNLFINLSRHGWRWRRQLMFILFLPFFISVCVLLRQVFQVPDRARLLVLHKSPNSPCVTAKSPRVVKNRVYQVFDDEQVLEFRRSYISQCRPSQPVLYGVLGHIPIKFPSGYGSALNSLLSFYCIANQPSVNRSFRILIFDWEYASLTKFFVDFAEKSPCPLFRDFDFDEIKIKTSGMLKINFSINADLLTMEGPDEAMVMLQTQQFHQARNALMHLCEKEETRWKVFRDKSVFARALWNLRPEMKKIIYDLVRAVQDPNDKFMAVHIRRGDKITSTEMDDIPVLHYIDKIKNLCSNCSSFHFCPGNIFLMCDDKIACETFRRKISDQFSVKTLFDLVLEIGLNSTEWIAPLPSDFIIHPGESGDGVPYSDRQFWDVHTKEIVISITLLAVSDYVFCTFSSNLCRFVALLKSESGLGNIYSLDDLWFPF